MEQTVFHQNKLNSITKQSLIFLPSLSIWHSIRAKNPPTITTIALYQALNWLRDKRIGVDQSARGIRSANLTSVTFREVLYLKCDVSFFNLNSWWGGLVILFCCTNVGKIIIFIVNLNLYLLKGCLPALFYLWVPTCYKHVVMLDVV